MKSIFLIVLVVASGVITASAQTDLNTRKAMYFTGAKTNAIDLAKDVYVAGGSTLSLSAELRTTCDNNVCEFNVGVIAFRGGGGALTTNVSVQVEKSGETFTKTVSFGPSEITKQVIFPIKLKLGKNQVTVTIDPTNKTVESDENNNSFSGTVMVSWKRANPGAKN